MKLGGGEEIQPTWHSADTACHIYEPVCSRACFTDVTQRNHISIISITDSPLVSTPVKSCWHSQGMVEKLEQQLNPRDHHASTEECHGALNIRILLCFLGLILRQHSLAHPEKISGPPNSVSVNNINLPEKKRLADTIYTNVWCPPSPQNFSKTEPMLYALLYPGVFYRPGT